MGRLRGAGRTPGSSLSEKPGGSARGGGGGGGGGYGDGDVAKLKEAIQTLCQSTHPLGETLFCKWYHAAREKPYEQRGRVGLSGSTGHERCFHHSYPTLCLKLCIYPKIDPYRSGTI